MNEQNKGKKQVAALWILGILVVILIAIIVGLFIIQAQRKNDEVATKDVKIAQLEQELVQVKKQVEQKENEMLVTKTMKIDENKDWVYDAKYEKNVNAESYVTHYNKEYYAKDIIVPYININSEDAEFWGHTPEVC